MNCVGKWVGLRCYELGWEVGWVGKSIGLGNGLGNGLGCNGMNWVGKRDGKLVGMG